MIIQIFFRFPSNYSLDKNRSEISTSIFTPFNYNNLLEDPSGIFNNYKINCPIKKNNFQLKITTDFDIKNYNNVTENENKTQMKEFNNNKKFITDYAYGYKCSCTKTYCNRFYCECYRMGRFCKDCNCKNCKNKPPANSLTNKHPSQIPIDSKKVNIVCTCTRSGCNKKYCECYKNGNKCNSECRCVKCENRENEKKSRYDEYECCIANSIYIIKNELFVENIKKYKENKTFMNKRKRNNVNKNYIETINDDSEEKLFDENGKMILRNIELIN